MYTLRPRKVKWLNLATGLGGYKARVLAPGLQHFAHFVKTQFPIRFIDVDLTKEKKKLK